RVTRRYSGAHGRLALSIQSVDARWADAFLDLDKVIDSHQTGARRRHVETRDRGRVFAILVAQAKLNVVVFSHRRIAKTRNAVVAANHQTQRGGDVRSIHA